MGCSADGVIRFFAFASVVALCLTCRPSAAQPAASDPEPEPERRPTGLLLGVTPGFGAAFESKNTPCSFEGRMFAGGFFAGYAPLPGVVVGGAAALRVNTLSHEPDTCDLPDDSHLALAAMIGPSVKYFLSRDMGLHIGATVGYASLSQSSGTEELESHGIGTAMSFGYAWPLSGTRFSLGLAFELATYQTFSREREHTVVSPALLGTLHVN